MAFGQQSGPPATAKQVAQLLALLQGVGHSDFRDARGPLGFTQRQAGGKFTRDEADAFIATLESEAESPSPVAASTAVAPRTRATTSDAALRRIPTADLAAELQRRGWIVVEP